MMNNGLLSESPLEQITIQGFDFYIKRDDLLNPYFSGNKARKFAYYLEQPLEEITEIIGYGSIQANSLYSLAALAKMKGWKFSYYVDRIPTWLDTVKKGNYAGALSLGAQILERQHLPVSINKIGVNLDAVMHDFSKTLPKSTLFIPEGGRSQQAQYGINILANELATYCTENRWFEEHNTINIMLPSGTGVTALFLQTWFRNKSLPINVFTCACVGDSTYLEKQFSLFNTNKDQWPIILPAPVNYHFGKLNAKHYQLWSLLYNETQIKFELLYDPIGWECILHYVKETQVTTPIIYIHQGGLVGNQTMLPRYKRKYPHLFSV